MKNKNIASKYREILQTRWRYILIALCLIMFIFTFKDLFILLALGLILILWDYTLHRFRIPIHIDGLFFASILLAHAYGFKTALIFSLIVGNIAEIASGSFEASDVLSVIPIIALSWMYVYFKSTMLIVWIAFSALFSVLDGAMSFLLGEPPHKSLLQPVIDFFVNIFLFANFGKALLWVMQ